MQITINKKDFLLITKNLFDVGKKENKDIYLSLNEDRLKLSIATEDNFIMTTYLMPIKATVIELGECILPQKLYEILKTIEKEKDKTIKEDEILEIKANDNEIILTCESKQYNIPTISIKEWKEKLTESISYITSTKKITSLSISPSTLMEMYQQIIFASANVDFRTSLTGVLIETEIDKLKMVAGDGYRVSMTEMNESSIPTRSVIPKKAFLELKKYLKKSINNLTITIGETYINFACESFSLFWKLIADIFPDYKANIPDPKDIPVVINSKDLTQYIKEIDMIKSPTVFFNFQVGTIEITTAKNEFKQLINYKGSSENLYFKMDTKHLLEYLSVIGDGEIQIHATAENKPVLFNFFPEKTKLIDEIKYTYVFSPVR